MGESERAWYFRESDQRIVILGNSNLSIQCGANGISKTLYLLVYLIHDNITFPKLHP